MNQISQCFAALKLQQRAALMPFITMGYPYNDSALDLVPNLIAAGADLLELGIPFSDPMADGPVIQASSDVALRNGMTLELALTQIASLKQKSSNVPLIIMCYYNPILQYGLKEFAKKCHATGVAAVIVPDLPPELAEALQNELLAHCIDLIFLLTPNSPDSRIKYVVSKASGFIYLVSVLGVTGARNSLSLDIQKFIERVRAHTDLPLVVGFGISTPEQAQKIAQIADGVIVGSALINAISKQDRNDLTYKKYISSLSQAIRNLPKINSMV